jgi:hypothetical protein
MVSGSAGASVATTGASVTTTGASVATTGASGSTAGASVGAGVAQADSTRTPINNMLKTNQIFFENIFSSYGKIIIVLESVREAGNPIFFPLTSFRKIVN